MFSVRIKELRKASGITQEELAKRIGVERSSVGKYESTNVIPSADTLVKIAECLNTSTDYLLGKDDQPFYANAETDALVEKLHQNPGMRVLLDASQNLNENDLEFLTQMAEKLKVGYDE